MRAGQKSSATMVTASEDSGASAKESTRNTILRVAESLFADSGFSETSMRDVASTAGVALSQLHYYFGSKKDLYISVFLYRGDPIAEERKRLLIEAREKYRGQPIPHTILIQNFVLPYLNYARFDGETYIRLSARLHTEPGNMANEVHSRVFNETTMQYAEAFRESLSHLPDAVIYWRLVFLIGAYNYALLRSGRLEAISQNSCDSSDMEQAARQMMPFLEAAMVAPAPSADDTTEASEN